ncbi:helix-turn-helix transcriptional regulator [Hyphomicrobium sp.]|uniref:helix-turn-helix transcriptional regulator n=1 Tax=Hyphomicrobium sp. TaxID=82 RepID=UPI0025C1D1C6|nr:helix-turn-helix transcriptional regulator [Hyphomicrobium sp.]MCC7253911.1 helix-turn-helix transcriptional regulator [Hyphomicrobium sp.]
MDTPANPTPSFVAVNLKKCRDRLAWTQAQLAEAAGVSERTVQRAEDGESVSAETLSALAGALNVSLDDLRNAPKAEQELAAKYHVIRLLGSRERRTSEAWCRRTRCRSATTA